MRRGGTPRRRHPPVGAVILGAFGALSVAECRAPTVLRVASLSEIDCAKGARVAIVVAHDSASLKGADPSAFSTTCAPAASGASGLNDTGFVVLTPASGPDEPIAFALMTRPDGESPETCIDPAQATHCIVAHRQLRFSPHDDLAIPVELRLSCLGIVCPPAQTCRKGQCTDATLPPGCGSCDESTLAPASVPACGDVGGLQANAAWPMAGFCPTRAGRSGRIGPHAANVKWRFKTGAIASMAPAVGADGTIYIGSNDRNVYAIDSAGHEKWHAAVAGNINDSGFVIGKDGTLYVGVGDGNLYGFTPDGQKKWATSVQADIAFTPAAGGDGTLYIGGQSATVATPFFAIATDGTIKWQTAAHFGNSAAAIGADGTVYVGGSDSSLYALHPADGSVAWNSPTSTPPVSPSVGGDGTIYVPDAQNLYAFDAAGMRKWAVPIAARASGVALGPDDTVYVATQSKALLAVSAGGQIKWTLTPGPSWTRAPTVGGDGVVYVGGDDGAMYAVSPGGAVLFSVPTGGVINSQPAIGADGTLYLVSDDSFLYAVGP